MKRYIMKNLIVIALIMIGYSAKAQLSVGAELGLPMGDFGTSYNTGFGGTLRYDKSIDDNLSWTVSAGFLSFGVKTSSFITSGSMGVIPVNGGIKYYVMGGNKGFYGAADAGLFFLHASITGAALGGTISDSSTKFGFAPGVGYRMGSLDFSGRFNIVPNANYFSLRVAYIFNK